MILPKDCDILYLNDSKKLSEKKRELLYDEIYEKAVAIGIGMSSEEVIDEINILQATYKAMQQAISKLSISKEMQKAHRSQRQVLLRKLQGTV